MENDIQQESAPTESKYDRYKMLKDFDDTKAGVKGLVDAGVTEIPPLFALPSERVPYKPPNSSKLDISIPIIDLKDMHENTTTRENLVEEIRHASETLGFFQLVNHYISQDVLDKIMDGVRSFFEQPTETKMEFYSRDYSRKVKYNSNFELYNAKAANWRDTLACIMAPNPPPPEELPAACRLYGPIKELLSEKNPPKFKETTVGNYDAYYNNKGLGDPSPLHDFRL